MYKTEDRERFFREVFPYVKNLTQELGSLPDDDLWSVLTPEDIGFTMQRAIACLLMTVKIIEDDQIEIESLRAILKDREI